MKLAIGGDHAGFPLKGPVIDFLRTQGYEVEDFGTHSLDPVDFPDIARLVCEAVRSGAAERGIIWIGTAYGRLSRERCKHGVAPAQGRLGTELRCRDAAAAFVAAIGSCGSTFRYSLLSHDGAGSLTLPTLSGKVRVHHAGSPRYRFRRSAATLETVIDGCDPEGHARCAETKGSCAVESGCERLLAKRSDVGEALARLGGWTNVKIAMLRGVHLWTFATGSQ